MTTDVYISIYSDKYGDDVLEKDINLCVKELEIFEKKYSRFIENNELDTLNTSQECIVSPELFEILTLSKTYYKSTNGVFDPAIYYVLKAEGYEVSKTKKYVTRNISREISKYSPTFTFDMVSLVEPNRVIKPKDLKIDLGGIGKGYAIDKIHKILSKKYDHFCISIGGDMYLAGVDKEKDYPYWAIDIENPFGSDVILDLPTLLVSNKAIATSGINKRNWIKDGVSKNHLIDTKTHSSVDNELVCVTVIGENAVYVDVMAKTLLLLGLVAGMNYCKMNNVAAVFISKSNQLLLSERLHDYVWKD